MRWLLLVLGLLGFVGLSGEAGAANPCTNGSFEALTPRGFPADWSPVGSKVEVTGDAHSGVRALRLVRTADTPTSETGLNRGVLIRELQGGIDFWYKAVSAHQATLNVYVIPMSGEPVREQSGDGVRRATFTVPASHVGDGQWHHARLKYDFTDAPGVESVHFAARIVGTAGELLLDDLSYVERVGGILRVRRLRLDEDPVEPGRRATLAAQLENAGDELAGELDVSLALPTGIRAEPIQPAPSHLAPDETAWVRWALVGPRLQPGRIGLRATAGTMEALDSLPLAPQLALRSFGPAVPVATEGRPTAIECVVENTGSAILTGAIAEFALPAGLVRRTLAELAPGKSALLAVEFTPARQTPDEKIAVRVTADEQEEQTAESSLVVGAAVALPPPSGKLNAVTTDDYALLENANLRLAFRRNAFGFGPGEWWVRERKTGQWHSVAWLPRLSRVVTQAADGSRQVQAQFTPLPPQAAIDSKGALSLLWESSNLRLRVRFELEEASRCVRAAYELSSRVRQPLLAFDGPMLYATHRDEAIFPGLEWLVDDELSSSTLDIAEGHPHQIRYVVHPQMITIPAIGIHGRHGTVGLLWDNRPRAETPLRPAAVFASPDRFGHQRSHLAGLFLPSVPEYVEPNTREAAVPCALAPDAPLRLECWLYADGSAEDSLAAIDAWQKHHRMPEPAPLPHGSYVGEVQFSMRAYLESLWNAETKEWWTSKGGGPILSHLGRPRSFVADLLLGEILCPDRSIARRCRQRAEEVLALIGGEPRLDAQRFPGRFDLAVANPSQAAGLLSSREEDGSWRFDADLEPKSGPFVGRDYHELGPDNAVEVGTCARKAYEVLRYARIAGDVEAYRAMEKTLVLMESFRVPRAAQVWEVPVHTPDVLAAADAVDAYLEAYRFSGQRRWLEDAVLWARRGIPFVYLWEDPEQPFVLGGSIPVFGASWYNCSWFGRPVQWNGLRYAASLWKLAEYDQSQPWRKLAVLQVHSAIHQQAPDGEDVALWPDNISAIDGTRCAWVFAPRQILANLLPLLGRSEEPATVILGDDWQRLHVTAAATIAEAEWTGQALSFLVEYPPKEQGVVLVSNVSRPEAVLVDGEPVEERSDVERGDEPGWRYDPGYAYLSIRIVKDGASSVRVEGARFRRVERLPRLVERIAFEFDGTCEGWQAWHHIGQISADEGALAGTINGHDPYLGRRLLRVAGDQCPVIRVRMRVTAGQGGQLFWATEASPAFSEDQSLRFDLRADGQYHEYVLEPGKHPRWGGQTITALRLDPGNGAAAAEFAIDYLRGTQPGD